MECPKCGKGELKVRRTMKILRTYPVTEDGDIDWDGEDEDTLDDDDTVVQCNNRRCRAKFEFDWDTETVDLKSPIEGE